MTSFNSLNMGLEDYVRADEAKEEVAVVHLVNPSTGKRIDLVGAVHIGSQEYYDSVTDFPEALRPLIAIEAVIYAFSKDKGIDPGILRLQQSFEENAINFLATDSPYEPTILGDFPLESGYTSDNPVAWLFKSNKIYLYKTFESDD